MKILVYSSVFYPSVGGIENLAMVLIREFLAQGHEVKVITEQKQDPSNPVTDFEIVESSDLKGQIRLFFWSDLVFMPNITLKAMWLFFLNPFKKLVISHNDFHLAYQQKWLVWLKRQVIKRAAANIAVSKSIADFLQIGNISVIHNCYNTEVFRIYPDQERNRDFIFVGRLVTSKGCDLLLEAFSRLDDRYNLTLVGDGAESENLKKLADLYRISDRVRFTGFLHGEELARELNRHKVMVFAPTGPEGFGLVVLEALACGCRVIVSDSGGLTEALGGFGDVCKSNDLDALREKMEFCIQSDTAETMDRERVAYLEGHSEENVAAGYLEIFKRTTGK